MPRILGRGDKGRVTWVWILGGLALISLAINLWQFAVARRFPLHPQLPQPAPDPAPGLSLLKPVKGDDPDTRTCLASWMHQDYSGEREVLFGVEEGDTAAAALVGEVLREHPRVPARVIVCAERIGPNGKVSLLSRLEREARHPVLVVSDADVRIAPGFLPGLVAPLSDPGVGLVHCLYAFANPTTLAMHWEAIGVNCDFWSQVLQSRGVARQDFALGAVMALRRDDLASIGGFAALADYLADDYQLGRRIVARGLQLVLSNQVAECWEAPVGWRDAWLHQVRWARTIRTCRPVLFFLSLVNNVTVWSLAWLASAPHSPPVWLGAATCLVARLGLAEALRSGIRRSMRPLPHLWIVWLKDLLGVVVWVAAFTGNRVVWRGVRYRVDRHGRLHAP